MRRWKCKEQQKVVGAGVEAVEGKGGGRAEDSDRRSSREEVEVVQEQKKVERRQ